MTRIKRTLALLTLAASLGASAVGLGANPAQAVGSSYCNSSTCSLATAPSTQYIYFEMPRATPVRMICWRSTQYWNGTAKWFKVSSIYGTGWMNANQVSNQSIVPARTSSAANSSKAPRTTCSDRKSVV